MKKKLMSMLSILLVGGLFLSSCAPMRQEDTTVDTWSEILAEWKELSPKELEEHVEIKVSDTYRMDANIMISDELDSYEVQNIYLTRHVYEDTKDVLEKWLAYCGVTSYSEIMEGEGGGLLEGGEKINYATADFGEENQSWAQIRSVYALMVTPFYNNYSFWNIQSMFYRQNSGWMDYKKMEIPSDKELLTHEQVLDIKENVESIFEVEFMDDYILYTYTLERLQEVAEYGQTYEEDKGYIVDGRDSEEITEADEGTVLVLQQGYEGIPLFYDEPSQNTTGTTWAVGNYCIITTSKEGVEGLDFFNPYDITGEAEPVEILSFGEFIEKHIQMRSGVDTMVVSVGLYYLPMYTGEGLNFVTKPIWCVQTETQDELGYPFRDTSIYDAVTGEELVWQE